MAAINALIILADFEIFDIVDALEKAEGKDTNFYNWLGVAVSLINVGTYTHLLILIDIALSNSKWDQQGLP